MKTVYKYKLFDEPKFKEIVEVDLPSDAEILSCGLRKSNLYIWAMVDTDSKSIKRKFILFGTGQDIPTKYKLSHIGRVTVKPSISMPDFEIHTFEILGETYSPG